MSSCSSKLDFVTKNLNIYMGDKLIDKKLKLFFENQSTVECAVLDEKLFTYIEKLINISAVIYLKNRFYSQTYLFNFEIKNK